VADSLTRPDPPLKRGIKRALLGPVNLGVAGAGALGAAAFGSVSLAVLGGVAYAALVAWDLSTPAFWRKVVGTDSQEGAQLPRPREVFDDETRAALERIHRARDAIVAAAGQAPAAAASTMSGVLGTLDEIDRRVGRLVTRSDELSRYLAGIDEAALHADLHRLEERARDNTDAEARRHYDEARAAREEQVRNVADIGAARERLVANLAEIVATLEGIPAKLVKIRALDAQAADDVSGDVGRQLSDINVGLGAFEETMQSLTGAES
jgi:hypothetical protein